MPHEAAWVERVRPGGALDAQQLAPAQAVHGGQHPIRADLQAGDGIALVVHVEQGHRPAALALGRGGDFRDQPAAHQVVDDGRGSGAGETEPGTELGAAERSMVDQVVQDRQYRLVGPARHGHSSGHGQKIFAHEQAIRTAVHKAWSEPNLTNS